MRVIDMMSDRTGSDGAPSRLFRVGAGRRGRRAVSDRSRRDAHPPVSRSRWAPGTPLKQQTRKRRHPVLDHRYRVPHAHVILLNDTSEGPGMQPFHIVLLPIHT